MSLKRVIWKYRLAITDVQRIMMPRIREPLCIQMQNGEPCLWMLVSPDPQLQQTQMAIRCIGTGHECDGWEKIPETGYLGTVQTPPFVWHFFAEERTA